MSTRGIQLQSNNTLDEYNPILPNEPVIFDAVLVDTFNTSINNSSNTITYHNGICSIVVTETTDNLFYIVWSVSINASSKATIASFTLLITDDQNIPFAVFPMSSSKNTGNIYSSLVVSLPYDPNGVAKTYKVSLINSSNAECCYNKKAFTRANLIITSLPS